MAPSPLLWLILPGLVGATKLAPLGGLAGQKLTSEGPILFRYTKKLVHSILPIRAFLNSKPSTISPGCKGVLEGLPFGLGRVPLVVSKSLIFVQGSSPLVLYPNRLFLSKAHPH